MSTPEFRDVCRPTSPVALAVNQTPTSSGLADVASPTRLAHGGCSSLNSSRSRVSLIYLENSFAREALATDAAIGHLAAMRELGGAYDTLPAGYCELSPRRLSTRAFSIVPRCLEDLDMLSLSERQSLEVSTTRQPSRVSFDTSLVGGLVSRMRLTSGVCLPSDLPIHVTCGSQDVIHSWAIPGLAIKIDCIPGYNCHRRLLLR